MRIEFLPWETDLFNQKCGKLVDISLGDPFDTEDYAFLYVKIPFGKEAVATRLCRRNFLFIETAVILVRFCHSISFRFNTAVQISEAHRCHSDALADIAENALTLSRFHKDPKIDHATAAGSRRQWVINAYSRPDMHVLAATLDDKPTGFLILKQDDKEAKVDLIAISKPARKQGIGRALMAEVIKIVKGKSIYATTQIINHAALQFYQKIGFVVTDGYYSFHWHKD
ncbi:MAG: GNAT family N-acetyltransferase [Desulfobacteraceae bacterium]|nr:MAG: GNAT family N-acetyltransferase [Desulfobacteraceae bacterium]